MSKKLTEQQKKYVYSQVDDIFKKYDKDKSGTLIKSEIKDYIFSEFASKDDVDEQTESNQLNEILEVVFKSFDLNSNGVITKDEMMKALESKFI